MVELKKKFDCRIEELPVLGGFIGNSFEASKSDFIDYSPDFNDPYSKTYQAKLRAAEAIIFPKKIIQELKVVTTRLYKSMEALRDPLNKLQGYVERAEGLSVKPKDFGLKSVRSSIASKDVEKFLTKLALLIQNIDANMDRLTAKGFKPATYELFVNAKSRVKEDNDLQNTKMNERGNLVQRNLVLLNELWDLMTDISKTGKILYKTADPAKAKEFTMSVLKERVRQENKRKAAEV